MNTNANTTIKPLIYMLIIVVLFSQVGCTLRINASKQNELIQQYNRNKKLKLVELDNPFIDYISIELCDSAKQEDGACYYMYRNKSDIQPYIQKISVKKQYEVNTMTVDEYEKYLAIIDSTSSRKPRAEKPIEEIRKFYKVTTKHNGKQDEYIIPFEQLTESSNTISAMLRKFILDSAWREMFRL
jgi:hypothetical protein